MKLKDFIATLLECQAKHGGDVDVLVNADDIQRTAKFSMVPVDVAGYNKEFDCIELF